MFIRGQNLISALSALIRGRNRSSTGKPAKAGGLGGEPVGELAGEDEVGGGQEGAVGGGEQGQAGALPGRDAQVLQGVLELGVVVAAGQHQAFAALARVSKRVGGSSASVSPVGRASGVSPVQSADQSAGSGARAGPA